jgi:hypothetical protein
MPVKPIKTELVIRPTKVVSIPIRRSNGDKAETYNFKNHNAGAGQCNRRKRVKLISATRKPAMPAMICMIGIIISIAITKLFLLF